MSDPVDIGPVTAVTLTGTTDAVNTWLGENGFVISEAAQATIADYAGYYFVAIRRNDRTAPGGPTSIGIHFWMAGDHRELPFRFASLGAAPSVAFTVFFFTKETVAPSAPFAALTLNDLDGSTLRRSGYKAAVERAVREHDHRAFVLESRFRAEDAPYGATIGHLFYGAFITRMSTVLPVEALTEDAHFHDTFVGEVPNSKVVSNHQALGAKEANMGWLGLLLLGMLRRRKPAWS